MHLAYISNRSPERAALRGLALPIYEELGDLLGQANVLNNLGVDAYYEGRWQEALEHYDRSKALRERIGDVVGAATITNNIGEIKSDQGYLTRPQGLAEEAREVFATAGHRLLLTHALSNLGRIAAREGRLEDAHGLLQEALAIAEEIESAGLVDEVKARLAEWAVLASQAGGGARGRRGGAGRDPRVGRRLAAERARPPHARLRAGAARADRRGAGRVRAEPRARAGGRRELRAGADPRRDRRPEDARRRERDPPRPPRREACWPGWASSPRPSIPI